MNKKIIWLSLNILILIYGIYLRSIASDGAIVFAYFLYFITFPLGFITPFIMPIITFLIGPIVLVLKLFNVNTYIIIDIIIPWISLLLVGYIQWFMLMPKINKWLDRL